MTHRDATRADNTSDLRPDDLRGQLRATARAVSAADGASLHGALDGVRWVRSGVLRRLARSPLP